MPSTLLKRLWRVARFIGASRVPSQWVPLALLGWARDNPSSVAGRWCPAMRVRPTLLRGVAVTVSARDLGQLMSFEEIFVEQVYDLNRVPFTPTAVFDCGSHVGFFAVLAGSTYARVPLTIFEPNPDNVDWLQRNLAPLEGRMLIHIAAVTTRDGTSRFAAAASNTGALQDAGSAGLEAGVMDLAALIPRDPEAALLIKMDVEGEERRLIPHVLPVLPWRCALFLETHDGPAACDSIVGLLNDAGFAVTRLRERGPFTDLFALRERV